MKINTCLKELKPSATLAINQKVISLRHNGVEVAHFGFGQSPFPIHASIINALRDNAVNKNYFPTVGYLPLRQQIASFLKTHQNIEANSNYIYIGPGSKELLYQSVLMFEGVFLIPKGSWVSYGPQIVSKGGRYKILETALEDDFKLQAKTLANYCKEIPELPKILILNSPNNPTGAVYTNDELSAIAKVCYTYDIIVFSDEIYSQLHYKKPYSPSIAKFYPEKTIVFGGLSKVFSAGGYRLGFMALPKGLEFLHSSYRSLFSETFSAVASPIQMAAIKAYEYDEDLQDYVQKCSDILKVISTHVYHELSKLNIICTQPQGGYYMMVGFSNFKAKINQLGLHTSQDLADYLLEKYHVALLPASDFYFDTDELFFRLAFVDFDGQLVLKQNTISLDAILHVLPNISKGLNALKKCIGDLKNQTLQV